MKKLYVALLALPLLAACGTVNSGAAAGPAEADLVARRYVLQKVNGTAFTAERTPEIEFGEGMSVSGQVCNRFRGNGRLEKGVLTVPTMASTMMLCADPRLNQLERDFAAMLRDGAALSLDGRTLTLSRGDTALEYSLGEGGGKETE
jgi:Heat shock protein